MMRRIIESADVFKMKIMREAGEEKLVYCPEEVILPDVASIFVSFSNQEEYQRLYSFR